METIRDCFSMESRIIRHHGYYFHPRTNELIIGIEHDEAKSPIFISRKHQSLVTPAVTHDRQQNRSCGVKLGTGQVIAVSPNGTAIVTPQFNQRNALRGKPTSQWKSVWFSKGMRRQ
jgi:hypothetical protein